MKLHCCLVMIRSERVCFVMNYDQVQSGM
jgi:hypothetical protein